MEHEMKISAAAVRRLRSERGWSQEHLAIASGLSLRTIQRVEAEGIASMATKVSLAATFGLQLDELSVDAANAVAAGDAAAGSAPRQLARLMLGLAVLSCVFVLASVLMVDSTRLPPLADALLALNLLLATSGALLAAPAAWRLLRARRIAGVTLAVLGMPLAVLMASGLLVAALRGHAPEWSLLAFGAGGIALIAMAMRESARPARG